MCMVAEINLIQWIHDLTCDICVIMISQIPASPVSPNLVFRSSRVRCMQGCLGVVRVTRTVVLFKPVMTVVPMLIHYFITCGIVCLQTLQHAMTKHFVDEHMRLAVAVDASNRTAASMSRKGTALLSPLCKRGAINSACKQLFSSLFYMLAVFAPRMINWYACYLMTSFNLLTDCVSLLHLGCLNVAIK